MISPLATEARGPTAKESIMCYEFSDWFSKARAAEKVRKERPQTEVTQQSQPAPEPQPAAPEPRVKESETAPA